MVEAGCARSRAPGRGREGLAKCGTAGFPATNTEPSSPRGNVATIFSAWTWVTETALAGWGRENSNYGICQDRNPFELRREFCPIWPTDVQTAHSHGQINDVTRYGLASLICISRLRLSRLTTRLGVAFNLMKLRTQQAGRFWRSIDPNIFATRPLRRNASDLVESFLDRISVRSDHGAVQLAPQYIRCIAA